MVEKELALANWHLVSSKQAALDRDVEIVIHRKSRRSKGGRILVTAA